ncbi:pentapeptide repeat-containing protein [Carnobacterium maltaromaticum]
MKIVKPKQTITALVEDQIVKIEEVESHTHYKKCQITSNFGIKKINEVIFENCTFERLDFKQMEFLDVIFDNCNLASGDFSEGLIYRSEFKNCQLSGANFIDSKQKNVKWQGCLLSYANYSSSNMESVHFIEGRMTESYFQDCQVKNVIFEEIDANGVDLVGSKLTGLDISKAHFDFLNLDISLAKGLKIGYDQAYKLITLSGIEIVE